ncbi:hypothetical protein COHCIP112018_03407 [Cohnella sp. JJ-181]|nr:hypothetical protein COHCIP112018_03407 [Cohnella sp. JJ-181]
MVKAIGLGARSMDASPLVVKAMGVSGRPLGATPLVVKAIGLSGRPFGATPLVVKAIGRLQAGYGCDGEDASASSVILRMSTGDIDSSLTRSGRMLSKK